MNDEELDSPKPTGGGGDETMGNAPSGTSTMGNAPTTPAAPSPATKTNTPMLIGGGVAILAIIAIVIALLVK